MGVFALTLRTFRKTPMTPSPSTTWAGVGLAVALLSIASALRIPTHGDLVKLLIHASLFASGSIEVDTETGKATFLCPPIVKDDQGMLTSGPVEEAERAGLRALAALHQAITDKIISQVAKAPEPEPIPLTNVLGGTGKASA